MMVYLVRCSDNSLYCGISTDVDKRIKTHNSGRGAKYTRSRLPVSLAWCSANLPNKTARQLEYEIKSWPKSRKEGLINGTEDYNNWTKEKR